MTSSTAFLESSKYTKAGLRLAHTYLVPSLLKCTADIPPGSRVLDIGCGNGSVGAEFVRRGYRTTGIDMAEAGIRIARESCPGGRFEVLPADAGVLDNLKEEPFDLVYSLEVIEHLYDPRSFMAGCFAATKRGGTFVCSTPYHGFLKNLTISLMNGWDKHADPLFDGGHVKLFSKRTLSLLLQEAGFRDLRFVGAGRLPYLWKSMLMVGRKP